MIVQVNDLSTAVCQAGLGQFVRTGEGGGIIETTTGCQIISTTAVGNDDDDDINYLGFARQPSTYSLQQYYEPKPSLFIGPKLPHFTVSLTPIPEERI